MDRFSVPIQDTIFLKGVEVARITAVCKTFAERIIPSDKGENEAKSFLWGNLLLHDFGPDIHIEANKFAPMNKIQYYSRTHLAINMKNPRWYMVSSPDATPGPSEHIHVPQFPQANKRNCRFSKGKFIFRRQGRCPIGAVRVRFCREGL